jgi:GT2 family glycosyltransferase
MSEHILIVVLNYNGAKETVQCLDGLKQQTHQKHKVFLLDNASASASIKLLENYLTKKVENIVFQKESINHGFAGGVNIGIKYAIENGYKYVALVNNDAILDKNWLKVLVDVMNTHPKVGITTGLMLDKAGKKIDSAGDGCSSWGMPFPRFRGHKVSQAPDSGYVFGATGGASLYRTSLFKRIGLFDEKFFAYFEDSDISFRAQITGHKVYYEKNAISYHNHGTTSSKIQGFTVYHSFKNLPMFVLKNFPAKLLLPTLVKFIPLRTYSLLKHLFKKERLFAIKGMFSALKLLPYTLKERRKIQSSKTVSNKYLTSIIDNGRAPRLPK